MDKSKLKYLVLTPYFPTPESWRGGFCYDFVAALKRTDKYDVSVFVPGKGDDYVYNSILVHRFKRFAFPLGLFPWFVNWLNEILFARKLKKLGIDIGSVAVCHSHEISCLPIALSVKKRNRHIKLVHHFHAMGHPVHLSTPRIGRIPVYSTFLYLYCRRLFESVDIPVFVSKRQCGMFGRWYPSGFLSAPSDIRKGLVSGGLLRKMELKKPYVLYNGIDYSVYYPASERKPQEDKSIVIGDVANFCESKDQITLIKAVEELVVVRRVDYKVKCILIGSGETLQKCRKYVGEHGLESVVEFRPEIDHLKLADFYRSLDLFVSPSWAEGFGCTFVEAHGCGIPIMGCKGVSVDECFSDGEQEKWLFAPQDYKSLARMIEKWFKSRPKQNFVDRFDIDELVGKFVRHLEKIS